MDPSNLLIETLWFVALLILSAFFSGSETAFFSLRKDQLRNLKNRDDISAKIAQKLLDKPRDLLVAILIGNTVVNTAAASIAAITVHRIAMATGFDPLLALIIQIMAVTFVLLVLVEISPKMFALKHNLSWTISLAAVVQMFLFILWPLTKSLGSVVGLVATMFGVKTTRVLFSEEELRTLAEIGEDHGVLEEDEKEMIHSIFEFGETEVREVMIPRIDIIAIPHDSTIREARALVREKGHSRIPVYENDVDHVVGIIYAKDLLGKELSGENDDLKISELMRKTFFVPEHKLISALLKDFQREKKHMAVVVDEYGGTEGLVTLEDVIEEIVGEIHDEFDTEEVLCKKLEDGSLIVQAKIEVDEFNRVAEEELIPTDGDFETLGGFIFQLAGEVPTIGQNFPYEGWSFKVTGIEGTRIVTIKVYPPPSTK